MSTPIKQFNQFANARNITPVTAVFGKPQATKLYVISVSDNLSTAATFSYTLLSLANAVIGGGTVIMNGTDYQSWTGDNSTPYTFIASHLGFTLI